MDMIMSMVIEAAAAAAVLVPVLLVCNQLRFHSGRKTLAYCIFCLYLAVMGALVGLPSITYIRFGPNVNLIPFAGMGIHTLLNVLLFVPFGFALPCFWQDRRHLGKVALEGFLLSLLIELLQIFTFRATDINDLITNTLGAVVGYGLAWGLERLCPGFCIKGWDSKDRFLLYGAVLAVMMLVQPTIAGALWELVYYR